jgi:hypothetical protein
MSERTSMIPALDPLNDALRNPPPWLLPYLPLVQEILVAARSQSVAAALNASRGASSVSVRFVKHSMMPACEPYESFIARTASVPARDNVHDLLNGLMWLTYPRTKQQLNVMQAREIELRGISGARGPLRDALTLFDENAAMLQAPAGLLDALRRRDWHTLFVTQRAQWQSTPLVLFGHALLEKLLHPRKAITAHVWQIEDPTDGEMASSLTRERLLDKSFLPLPVLGVPGWWSANEDPSFYADEAVFRRFR